MTKKDFRRALKELGFASYESYLASPYWKLTKQRYRGSNLPQECIGCGEAKTALHHRTYERLGCEDLGDLIPLCNACHKIVHHFSAAFDMSVESTHKIMQKAFGWTDEETQRKFAPFIRRSKREHGLSFDGLKAGRRKKGKGPEMVYGVTVKERVPWGSGAKRRKARANKDANRQIARIKARQERRAQEAVIVPAVDVSSLGKSPLASRLSARKASKASE